MGVVMKKYLAFDFGGTFVKYGVVGENAEIVEKNKVKTPKTLDELVQLIEIISQENPNTKGIAISSPGAVSNEGFIYGSSAIQYIHGTNIKELIAARTGQSVYLENDANCAGYAEIWKGSAKGRKDVLVIVIGTGIGGAVIKNGSLHKGANLHGGEFGYMLLSTDLESSDDVWSRIASTKALVKRVAQLKLIEPESLSGEEIFELAEAGDQVCIDALDRFYHLLAIGIYNLQYVYDPEVILLGGGISEREDLVDRINEKLDRILDLIHLAKVKPKIDTCKFRQNANILGAVYGFIRNN